MRIKKAASGAPPQVYLMLPDLQVTKLTPRATTQMPVCWVKSFSTCENLAVRLPA